MNAQSHQRPSGKATAGHQDPSCDGLAVIVMAAGMGTRMRSKRGKVLHPVAGKPMVLYAVELAERFGRAGVAVVVGHQADQVRTVIEQRPGSGHDRSALAIVVQKEQLGTGHAVLQTKPVFAAAARRPVRYLILNGDTPLLSDATIHELLRVHEDEKAVVTILTAVLDEAAGYGRVVRDGVVPDTSDGVGMGGVRRIVEDRDAGPAERRIREINVGTYVVDGDFLFSAIDRLQPQNAQREYYLTDVVQVAVAQGLRVSASRLRTSEEGLGVNTRQQLASAERVIRQQIRDRWLEAGVTLRDPLTTWIDADVTIGRDTVLYPNVTLEGRTTLGEDCIIRSNTRITDCVLGRRVEVLDNCVCREATIEDDTVIGPFAHLRPDVIIRQKAKVGNFVEMKKAELGEGAKANHLSYLGDARIGKQVNIGAGTITCNYDGVRKYQTVIEDNVFIGSDTQLVAPVTVGQGAIIAAGTTVTQDVPADALAISRVPQVNNTGWAARRRALAANGGPEARGQRHGGSPLARGSSPFVKSGASSKKGRKK